MNNALSILGKALNVNAAIVSYQKGFMENFSKEERQKNGKVYTGDKSIVKWIHDKLEQYNPISLNKTYWEPTCGTGSFVIDWYERLMIHWSNNKEKYLLKDEHEAHKWIIEKCLYFSDIDEFAIRLCVLRLYLKDPTVQCLWNKFVGDSLLDEPFKEKKEKFDYVAGNPPYVGFKTGGIPIPLKRKYEEKYTFYSGIGGDLLNLFFELSTTRGNSYGFVTSRYWLETPSLTIMRNALLPTMLEIWDHGNEEDMFSGVSVKTSCFIGNVQNKSKDLIYNGEKIIKTSLIEGGWYFNKEHALLAFSGFKTVNDYCDVIDGVLTGLNEVFIVPQIQADEQELPILGKSIGGRGISKWSIDWPGKVLLKQETSLNYTMQVTPLAKYLKSNEDLLLKRVTTKKPNEYREDTSFSWINYKGIIGQYYVNSDSFGFALSEGYIGCKGTNFIIYPKNQTLVKTLLALFNSKTMEFYFKTKVKRRATNYMISATGYRELPMPKEFPNFNRLDPLVDKMLLDPNDKITEAEINKIVYELYDLTLEEIKIVEETVK